MERECRRLNVGKWSWLIILCSKLRRFKKICASVFSLTVHVPPFMYTVEDSGYQTDKAIFGRVSKLMPDCNFLRHCFTALCNSFNNFELLSQEIRCNTKIISDLFPLGFQRCKSVRWIYLESSLTRWIIFLYSYWRLRLNFLVLTTISQNSLSAN